MNGYKCFYRGKRCEVMAETSYEAQQKGAKELGAKKTYDVAVVICEVGGDQVVHTAVD